jgi:hypothetical protein
MNKRKKVGILSLPYDANYGWVLQHYALYKIIKLYGHEPISICRKWNRPGSRPIAYHIKKFIYYNLLSRNIFNFYKKNINNRTEIFDSQESLTNITRYDLEAIVVGSDQVWRTEFTSLVGNNFFLDFVESKKISKLSYAASFGTDEWIEGTNRTAVVKTLLDDFDYISVREISGIDLCKKEFEIKVESVVDPTLLLNKDQYNELIDSEVSLFQKPTLITYILDHNKSKSNLVTLISKSLTLAQFHLYPKRKKIWSYFIRVEKWLGAFRDCDFVITDSFHGTVFAIIYNKQFITIANKERGLTRFTSLLNLFNLSSRLVFMSDQIDINKLINDRIDFKPINGLVKKEQERSKTIFDRFI